MSRMVRLIKKNNILPLIKDLQKKYDVYAPVRRDDSYLFEEIRGREKIDLDYNTTILSPKNIFFPGRDVIVNFKNDKVKIPEFRKNTLIFGIHPCDVHALLILDGIFLARETDLYYYERRKNSVIVAVKDKNVPNAFYDEFDHDYGKGIDLFLEDAGDSYIATPFTRSGREILNSRFFESNNREINNNIPKKSRKFSYGKFELLCNFNYRASSKKLLNLNTIKLSIEKGPDQKIWAEIAEECFGCGICSYVCPICHCFDIEDNINLDGISGCRCRRHDSCMLYEFSLIHSRINFRERLQDRIYNWYHHKFVRAPIERGVADCVGCGRCITFCPAGIDIKGILDRLNSGL